MTEEQFKSQILNSVWYVVLKYAAMVGLPALATFVATFAQIWGITNGDKIALSITAANVLLGALVAVSTFQYNRSDARFDGTAFVVSDPGGVQSASLELKDDPENLPNKKEIHFKVENLKHDGDTFQA